MWWKEFVEDSADNRLVVLVAYLAVGIPLNFYLYHDVIDKRWRSVDELGSYCKRYRLLSTVSLVLLCFYASLQFEAGDYKEGGAAVLSCAIAIYGVYLCRRQAAILRFFHNHLQWRANDIASVYGVAIEGETLEMRTTPNSALYFPEWEPVRGPVNGSLSSVFLDDNYPGDGPRVTWLRPVPEVKDWTELMIRTGLWIRLAVLPADVLFDTGLRPRILRSWDSNHDRSRNSHVRSHGSHARSPRDPHVDTSAAWTVGVLKEHYLTPRCNNRRQGHPEKLDCFLRCVEGGQGSLTTWRDTLSATPISEWQQVLAEFPPAWIEGLDEQSVAWEVFLALALDSEKSEGLTAQGGACQVHSPQSTCSMMCGGVSHCVSVCCCCWGGEGRAPRLGDVPRQYQSVGALHQYVGDQVRATLEAVNDASKFVTPAVLMGAFPQKRHVLWFERVRQLVEVWHHLANAMTSNAVLLDKSLTIGVDLVVALALLLGANKSSFELSPQIPDGQTSVEDVLMARRTFVIEKLQDDEAEQVLRESLARRVQRQGAMHVDVAESRYSLGRYLQTEGRRLQNEIKNEEAQTLYTRAIQIWETQGDDSKVATGCNQLAELFEQQRKYDDAERYYKRALKIYAEVNGADSLKVAMVLHNQAGLFKTQGKYEDALRLYDRCLAIRKRELGPDHPDVATTLNKIGELLKCKGDYSEAWTVQQQVVEIQTAGGDTAQLAAVLNSRAELLQAQGKYDEAEALFEHANTTWEEAMGNDHPLLAQGYNSLAGLWVAQGKYDEAASLYRRALTIDEKGLGPEHPNVAKDLDKTAGLLANQGRYAEADNLYKRSLAIRERALGPDHPDVAISLDNQGKLLQAQGKYHEADRLYQRAVHIREKVFGADHPEVGQSLNNRALLLVAQGDVVEAERLYARAIEIGTKSLGPDHPDLAAWLKNRAELLRKEEKYAEAESLYRRIQGILAKSLGPHHPRVMSNLNNLAGLLQAQGEFEEAASLYKRCVAGDEDTLGKHHPQLAAHLANWAGLMRAQGNTEQAESTLRRALAIDEAAFGPTHPNIAKDNANLAGVAADMGKYEEAKMLYERSVGTYEVTLGLKHPKIAAVLDSLSALAVKQERHDEAVSLLKRALDIRIETLGNGHKDTINTVAQLETLRKKTAGGIAGSAEGGKEEKRSK